MQEMKFGELLEKTSTDVKSTTVTLDRLRVDGGNLLLNGEEFVSFDELSMAKIGKYLEVPPSYLQKCPPELVESNLNFWFERKGHVEVRLDTAQGELTNAYSPQLKIIPIESVLDIMSRQFEENDDVHEFRSDPDYFHVDITSPRFFVDVPGTGDEERGRPEVGDITHGGIRVLGRPSQGEKPIIETYTHRLWCANGATTRETDLQVTLRGNTVDEVLLELEENAKALLARLPEQFSKIKQTAEMEVPGHPEQFLLQTGREAGLGSRLLNTLVERASSLPENPSLYDVTQVVTSLANEDVSYNARLGLQGLGGEYYHQPTLTTHRCSKCERSL